MHSFHAPTLLDEFDGEQIEQFGVGRPHSERPEVPGGVDQPMAKVIEPNAVHQHASYERMHAIGQMPSVRQAPACCWKRWIDHGHVELSALRSCDGKVGGSDDFLRFSVVAPVEKMRVWPA